MTSPLAIIAPLLTLIVGVMLGATMVILAQRGRPDRETLEAIVTIEREQRSHVEALVLAWTGQTTEDLGSPVPTVAPVPPEPPPTFTDPTTAPPGWYDIDDPLAPHLLDLSDPTDATLPADRVDAVPFDAKSPNPFGVPGLAYNRID